MGKLEIPETVLEELLQNALGHADLLKTAAILLLVFDDRVEIINPGCIMGGHSIEEVMLGNSFARNPLMANLRQDNAVSRIGVRHSSCIVRG